MRRSPAQSQTKAIRAILESERTALRTVTTAEKLALKGRFSPGGAYLVPKTVRKVGARTAYVTVTRFKDFAAGISHGAAAAARKAGLLGYKSAASEEQAAKQRATKATPESQIARIAKAQRHARRRRASSKAGIAAGRNQRIRTFKYLDEGFAKHERYLKTGQGRIDDQEYRTLVNLMYENGYDDDRIERMKGSYIALAA